MHYVDILGGRRASRMCSTCVVAFVCTILHNNLSPYTPVLIYIWSRLPLILLTILVKRQFNLYIPTDGVAKRVVNV